MVKQCNKENLVYFIYNYSQPKEYNIINNEEPNLYIIKNDEKVINFINNEKLINRKRSYKTFVKNFIILKEIIIDDN